MKALRIRSLLDRIAQTRASGDAPSQDAAQPPAPRLAISSAEMVDAARSRIEEIEIMDLIALHRDPDVVVVDLRDVRERQKTGFIPESVHCPRGMAEFWVDPDSPYFKPVFGQDKEYVFYCASGWRSALTVATLNDMGFRCAHLREGFSAWRGQGGPLQYPKDHAPRSAT